MRKIIFAAATAIAFSLAMGVTSAYDFSRTAKTTGTSANCACSNCSCPDCRCTNCNNGNCKGCNGGS